MLKRLPKLNASAMKAIDRFVIEEVGIPALCLMENAGRAVAKEAWAFLGRRAALRRRVGIFCGTGNNGGDGMVVARHLANLGARPTVVVAGPRSRFSREAALQHRILQKLEIPLLRAERDGIGALCKCDLIVDALFGVGLSRPVSGPHKTFIEKINAALRPVLAVDVPSGLDATTGKVLGACIKASLTVTLGYPKQGLFIGDGPRQAGRVVVADIGLPRQRCDEFLRRR